MRAVPPRAMLVIARSHSPRRHGNAPHSTDRRSRRRPLAARRRTGGRGEDQIFTPPGYEIVGRKVTFEDLQKPALYYNKVTKHYEITLKPGANGKLTGALHLTFSFIVPTYPMPTMIIYGCVGKTKFTAKPLK